MQPALIQTNSLSKIFNAGKPNQVCPVESVDVNIQAGTAVLLKGPSGSGKSTLLSLLACLMRPTSGEYLYRGEQISRWSEKFLTRFRQAHIGVVFQQFRLISGYTAAQNIGLPLFPLGLPEKILQEKVDEAAQLVGITHRLAAQVATLSGGEMQRVAIARALVNTPEVILADEPTSQLDSAHSANILSIFADLKKQGKTIVLTSHDPIVEQSAFLDQTLLMRDGRLSRLS